MWIVAILIGMGLLTAIFLLNFYRDPERRIPKGNNIVSPADGKVISIIDTSKDVIKVKKGFIGKIRVLTKDVANQCYVVSIFMSPLDVHVNRAPIEGTIKSIKHTKGKFFKAYDLEKSLENEKNEIVIENKKLKIKIIQIAGFLARRIICRVKLHQKVNKGQRIGMIALGSQATIIMPGVVKLKIRLGDRVKAGSTIIAEAQ